MVKKNTMLRNVSIVVVTLMLMGLIVFLVGRSFGFFQYAKKGDTVNVVTINGLDVNITNNSENALNLQEAYPMYDSEGLELSPLTFTIENTSSRPIDYTLKVENDTEKQAACKLENNDPCLQLSTDNIKVAYSINGGSYSEPKILGSTNNNIIYNETINRKEVRTIAVKLWIDSSAGNEIQGKYFFGKLIIEGTKALASRCDIEANAVYDFPFDPDGDGQGQAQTFTVPCEGTYKIELWGAQGGSGKYSTLYAGGKGGYTAGNVLLDENSQLYLYVGGMGTSHSGTTTDTVTNNGFGYNGGSQGRFYASNSNGGGGGGATDIRYFGNTIPTSQDLEWNSSLGLNSRIMVAAGGGDGVSHADAPSWSGTGGSAGGINGYRGNYNSNCYYYGEGGKQTSGGRSIVCSVPQMSGYSTKNSGTFGNSNFGNAGYGGGGGYYGGGGSQHSPSGGGSSYISGHHGCLAIAEDSTAEPRTLKDGCTSSSTSFDCAKHYSDLYFSATKMIDGSGYSWSNTKGALEQMPNPNGGYYASGAGHTGNGYARITYLGKPLIPVMTDNTSPSGISSGSSLASSNYDYYYTFCDGTCLPLLSYSWVPGGSDNSPYIQYQFSEPVQPTYAEVNLLQTVVKNGAPKYNIEASNDGTTWTNLVSNVDATVGDVYFDLPDDISYQYYRVHFNQLINASSTVGTWRVYKFQLYN